MRYRFDVAKRGVSGHSYIKNKDVRAHARVSGAQPLTPTDIFSALEARGDVKKEERPQGSSPFSPSSLFSGKADGKRKLFTFQSTNRVLFKVVL